MARKSASVHTISELPTDHPMALIARRRLIGEHLMLSWVVLEQGFEVEPHEHPNEQFAIVLEGRIEFALDDGVKTLSAGQVLQVPPNVRHGARALERTVILDCFSPPSERTGVDAAPPAPEA